MVVTDWADNSREKNTELSKYVWELKEKDVILLIGILLWNRTNMFLDPESVIYAFVRSSLLQEQILMYTHTYTYIYVCVYTWIKQQVLYSL